MPKVDWDYESDGVPMEMWEYDCSSDSHSYPLFDEDDGLVHSIDHAGPTYEGEAYVMFCGKEFTHDLVYPNLGKEVNCLMCLAMDHALGV
jgi:hypothetical protein